MQNRQLRVDFFPRSSSSGLASATLILGCVRSFHYSKIEEKATFLESKNEFFGALKAHFPGLVPKYSRLYRNNSKYGEPDRMEAKLLGTGLYKKLMPILCKEHGVELRGWD